MFKHTTWLFAAFVICLPATAAEVTQTTYDSWYVAYDDKDEFCYLKTDTGNLTFGFAYSYNTTQLFLKKSDWNYPDMAQFNVNLTMNMFNNPNESKRTLKVYYDPVRNLVSTIDGINVFEFMLERSIDGTAYLIERIAVDFPGDEPNWYFNTGPVLNLLDDFRACQNQILNSKTGGSTLPFDTEMADNPEKEQQTLPKVGDQNPPMIGQGIILTPEMEAEIQSEQEGDQAEAEALEEYLERMQ